MHAISRVKYAIVIFTVALICVAATTYYYYQQIKQQPLNVAADGYLLKVPAGTSLIKLTRQLKSDAVITNPTLVRWYAFCLGVDNDIKAGEYKIRAGITLPELLDVLVRGAVTQYTFTIIEGWRTEQVIAALHANPKIKNTLAGLSEQEILQKLALPETHLEGIFLPDTYYFPADTTDVAFLKRAYNAMQNRLKMAWQQRAPHSVLQNPYEALILASIIEKESGIYSEYPEISGVFQRRMQKGMRLQADPCVIYGLGSNFSGLLLKNDLQNDSPYNTYTRRGLPPTPIAIPSMRAIEAALHPAVGETMYFVATKDGKHVFSKDLRSHNLAVKQSRD